MRRTRSGPGRAAAVAIAGVVIAVALSSTASATDAPVVHKLDPLKVWTDTGVKVHRGERVVIAATGTMHFGVGAIDHVPPAGIAWGQRCERISPRGVVPKPWPLPGVACWSLIARIGTGRPVLVGGATKLLTADRDGTVEIGINDNHVEDNRGSWAVTLTVVPPRGVPVTAAPSKTSTSPLPFVAGGLLALAAVIALLVVIRRRRAKSAARSRAPVPAPVALPEFERPATAVEPENDDVNIFEVEVAPQTLRIGYSYFTDGTVVRWRIRSNGTAASGEFVAEGGTEPHFVTLTLDDDVPAGARTDVRFDWLVGSVPFAYAVTREAR